MKLYVPLPGTFKFQDLYDGYERKGESKKDEEYFEFSKYVQKYTKQDTRTSSVWYLEKGINLNILKAIMNKLKIYYYIKEE